MLPSLLPQKSPFSALKLPELCTWFLSSPFEQLNQTDFIAYARNGLELNNNKIV